MNRYRPDHSYLGELMLDAGELLGPLLLVVLIPWGLWKLFFGPPLTPMPDPERLLREDDERRRRASSETARA